MEKQLHLFIKEKNIGSDLWILWPEETRQKIENMLANLIVKFIVSSIEEAEPHEKR